MLGISGLLLVLVLVPQVHVVHRRDWCPTPKLRLRKLGSDQRRRGRRQSSSGGASVASVCMCPSLEFAEAHTSAARSFFGAVRHAALEA